MVVAAAIVGTSLLGTFCYALLMLTHAGAWFLGPGMAPDWPAVFIAWFMGSLLMVPLTTLVGVLGYFLLRRYRLFRWWSVGLIGALLGLVASLVFRVLPIPSTMCFGALTALLAWAIIWALTTHSSGRPPATRVSAAKFGR
jgi:hypothetical protein